MKGRSHGDSRHKGGEKLNTYAITMSTSDSIPATSEAVSRAIISPLETARILDLSLPSIYSLKCRGRLPAIVDSQGRLVGFLRSDVLPLVGGAWRQKSGIKRKHPIQNVSARRKAKAAEVQVE
jgi:predicted DNA-binding transcriptional regulator AlpA